MMDSVAHPVILLGPTAVGKTAVSIPLARMIGAEIISADSRQVYVGLDIGTAKPSMEERGGVPHHLIDIVPIDQNYTVADFQKLALETINAIHERGNRVLVAGGTGLYVRALVDQPGYQDQPPDPEIRRAILDEIAERGSQALYDELKAFDPEAASKIHANNLPRLVRAIEVIRITMRPFSESVKRDQERKAGSESKWKIVGLTMDRDLLYDRINRRVAQMIDAGWLDEVSRVLDAGASGLERPLRGLGYKDIVEHVRGKISLDEALERVRRDTRRFAKRQMTFFRKIDGVQWIDLKDGFDPATVAKQVLSLVE